MADARTEGSACAAISCCTCGRAELHMRWPGCTCAGPPPSRAFPVALGASCGAQVAAQADASCSASCNALRRGSSKTMSLCRPPADGWACVRDALA
eukprot:4853364-Alexandrium_andersonii.AAC.1